MDDLVTIARIRKAHGIKGEVLADILTFDPTRFGRLESVTLRRDSDTRDYHIEKWRIAAQGVLLKFKEVADRNAAELLRGYEVLVPESERLPLQDSEAYLDEVIGMKVIDADTGELLGEVEEVHSYPAGAAYDIRMLDGRLHSISTTGNEVVSLSRSDRTVRVRLLEEY